MNIIYLFDMCIFCLTCIIFSCCNILLFSKKLYSNKVFKFFTISILIFSILSILLSSIRLCICLFYRNNSFNSTKGANGNSTDNNGNVNGNDNGIKRTFNNINTTKTNINTYDNFVDIIVNIFMVIVFFLLMIYFSIKIGNNINNTFENEPIANLFDNYNEPYLYLFIIILVIYIVYLIIFKLTRLTKKDLKNIETARNLELYKLNLDNKLNYLKSVRRVSNEAIF